MFFFRPRSKPVDLVIAGLGNPGPRYAHTRHNLGFEVLNLLGKEWSSEERWSPASDYVYLVARKSGKSVLLLKPTTYMNLSGNAVARVAKKYGFTPERLIIVHDDLDVTYGKVKMKLGGSPAGHKGVNSVVARLGTADFYRLKLGIGLDRIKGMEDYVLEQLNDKEWAEFTPTIDTAVRGLELFINEGPEEAVRWVNTHGKRLGENGISVMETNGG